VNQIIKLIFIHVLRCINKSRNEIVIFYLIT
jgi:hypothetical protein